eukprot:CAMPEP_0173312142 /NCGR_PEP_ID=MMETSP1143-20121109/23959_1 /TAXON_ID=483371 /ORGANISM="non described non described, Strain CCMP2298" /LENGTH=49 /DNA_ID= /DNA_START= /DNA_END= /DNA_ORIENTATION=
MGDTRPFSTGPTGRRNLVGDRRKFIMVLETQQGGAQSRRLGGAVGGGAE